MQELAGPKRAPRAFQVTFERSEQPSVLPPWARLRAESQAPSAAMAKRHPMYATTMKKLRVERPCTPL